MVTKQTAISRMLIISNRLPATIIEKEEPLVFEESIGGLAKGISAYLRSLRSTQEKDNYRWVGWPGSVIDVGMKDQVKLRLLNIFNSYPVFLSQEDIDEYYL